MTELNRRGNKQKCPACGWNLDGDAYRCPKCRIYFCYKCRARVVERDAQYQCMNQQCDCYGKLLCSACVKPIEEKDILPKDNATIVTLIAGGFVGLITLPAGPIVSAIAATATVTGTSFLARKFGFNVWLTKDKEERVISAPLCCIACKKPVKHL